MRYLKFVMVVAVLGLLPGAVQAQDQEIKENLKVFMRAKLKHSQDVLRGLTLEDFDTVAKSSQQLSLISNASQWQVFQTPEYIRRSGEFRKATTALTKAAKEKNVDAATLNYVKMSMQCIECHKYIRSVHNAALPDRSPVDTRILLGEVPRTPEGRLK